MAFEFFLIRRGHGFSEDEQAQMRARLEQMPHIVVHGSYFVFGSDDEKQSQHERVRLAEATELVASVHLLDDKVIVNAVGDRGGDRRLKEFVDWCQERWPCDLTYLVDEPLSSDELLVSEEDD